MSICIRNGVRYKRHQMIDRQCVKCGAIVVPAEQFETLKEQLIAKVLKQVSDGRAR